MASDQDRTGVEFHGFLTEDGIWDALNRGQLVISPLLENSQVGPAAVDLRLGPQILVMKQTSKATISPRKLDVMETRRIQRQVNLAIGEAFTLHPGQFVLGATLEYIRIPSDMTAMVLSRSKFGRAGLIVATASFVHPGWRGCLTLELFNAGVLPLYLDCGAPLAQLVLATAEPALQEAPPALIPTGPRFAVMKGMKDWGKLRSFQKFWSQQGWGGIEHD